MAKSRYTKEFVQERINLWLGAEEALATSKSYSIDGRALTRANLSEITNRIAYWHGELEKIETGRSSQNRVYRVIFH